MKIIIIPLYWICHPDQNVTQNFQKIIYVFPAKTLKKNPRKTKKFRKNIFTTMSANIDYRGGGPYF